MSKWRICESVRGTFTTRRSGWPRERKQTQFKSLVWNLWHHNLVPGARDSSLTYICENTPKINRIPKRFSFRLSLLVGFEILLLRRRRNWMGYLYNNVKGVFVSLSSCDCSIRCLLVQRGSELKYLPCLCILTYTIY